MDEDGVVLGSVNVVAVPLIPRQTRHTQRQTKDYVIITWLALVICLTLKLLILQASSLYILLSHTNNIRYKTEKRVAHLLICAHVREHARMRTQDLALYLTQKLHKSPSGFVDKDLSTILHIFRRQRRSDLLARINLAQVRNRLKKKLNFVCFSLSDNTPERTKRANICPS